MRKTEKEEVKEEKKNILYKIVIIIPYTMRNMIFFAVLKICAIVVVAFAVVNIRL